MSAPALPVGEHRWGSTMYRALVCGEARSLQGGARRRALATALVALAATLASPAAVLAATSRVMVTADSYTRRDHPNRNYGSASRISIASRKMARRSYLRFPVSLPAGSAVARATLRVHVTRTTGAPTIELRRVAHKVWRERKVTWHNQPAIGGDVADRASRYSKGSWVSLDATRLVRSGGVVSVALTASGRGSTTFNSREASTDHPRMVVRLAPANPQRATPTPQPTPTPTPPATGPPVGGQYPLRGMISRQSDGGFDVIAGDGFNLIDSSPGEADELPSGLKALTWIGDYDSRSCTWEVSNAQVAAYVGAHVGDPKIGVWFIADEPWVGGIPHCPTAPSQLRARTDLIHSIDPNAKTLVVLDANSAQESLDQLPSWKGTTDYAGLDPYICWQNDVCHYAWIDRIAGAAKTAGLALWGVIQAYGDTPDSAVMEIVNSDGSVSDGLARLPTPAELHEEFVHWRATSMLSYLVFSWTWPDSTPSLWLENHPELQNQLKLENGH